MDDIQKKRYLRKKKNKEKIEADLKLEVLMMEEINFTKRRVNNEGANELELMFILRAKKAKEHRIVTYHADSMIFRSNH